jgi:hypothetical protein
MRPEMVKLTNTEKYAVQGMIHNGKTPEQISKSLKKPLNSVVNYIEGELNRIQETVVDVEMQKAGVKHPNTYDSMLLKTQNGKSGVAVMTPGASAHEDEAKKIRTKSRVVRDNVFTPNPGKGTH